MCGECGCAVMADGGVCRRVLGLKDGGPHLGRPQRWQGVLDGAVSIRRVHDFEDGTCLCRVEDVRGLIELFVVED